MARVTKADVERIAATVSESLPADHSAVVSGRNGYTAVDHYDGNTLVDLLTIGTKSECYLFLQGMRRAQLIAWKPADVIPENAQLALGELGEAVMHDGPASDFYIERACEHLRGPWND